MSLLVRVFGQSRRVKALAGIASIGLALLNLFVGYKASALALGILGILCLTAVALPDKRTDPVKLKATAGRDSGSKIESHLTPTQTLYSLGFGILCCAASGFGFWQIASATDNDSGTTTTLIASVAGMILGVYSLWGVALMWRAGHRD